jgi:hypothetical protein
LLETSFELGELGCLTKFAHASMVRHSVIGHDWPIFLAKDSNSLATLAASSVRPR